MIIPMKNPKFAVNCKEYEDISLYIHDRSKDSSIESSLSFSIPLYDLRHLKSVSKNLVSKKKEEDRGIEKERKNFLKRLGKIE